MHGHHRHGGHFGHRPVGGMPDAGFSRSHLAGGLLGFGCLFFPLAILMLFFNILLLPIRLLTLPFRLLSGRTNFRRF